MESLIEIIKKWRDVAYTKQRQAIAQEDIYESNYQLGKIRMCNEFIEQLNEEIKKEETSKEGNTQGEQSND